MHIQEIFDQSQPSLSFEFFPPKTPEAFDALFETIVELESYQPSFVSVTYGAGGSTRDLTHKLVVKIITETSLQAVPHLTCVCHGQEELREIIEGYAAAGVGNILALGGDPPRDKPDYDRNADAFQHAAGLVSFIKEINGSGKHPHPSGFGIGVAGFPEGHPATPNRMKELEYLKAKVEAGADYIVTQLFFDNHDFYDFRERCELAGINVPIIAGIMPITSTKGMARMAELAAGAKFSAKLLRALDRAGDDEKSVERVGIHHATEQCRDLLDNDVAGIHFYTLNKSMATREIYANLGLRSSG
ncbi:MAG: methylenetetrahydrofolate reductase [NAD(P)H] [Verrucomicrobiota bacterium]